MGSLLGSLGGVGSHDGCHAGLGSGSSTAGISHLVALGGRGERSGEEQLCALGHDAHVGIGSAQCAGAAAHTQNHRHLRDDAGNLCDLRIQLGIGREHIQALGQLCAHRVIERDDRAAGLCGHLQDLDVLLNVLDGNSLAVLIDSVCLLTCCIAAGSTHRTIGKQRGVFPVIEKLGEDFSLIDL